MLTVCDNTFIDITSHYIIVFQTIAKLYCLLRNWLRPTTKTISKIAFTQLKWRFTGNFTNVGKRSHVAISIYPYRILSFITIACLMSVLQGMCLSTLEEYITIQCLLQCVWDLLTWRMWTLPQEMGACFFLPSDIPRRLVVFFPCRQSISLLPWISPSWRRSRRSRPSEVLPFSLEWKLRTVKTYRNDTMRFQQSASDLTRWHLNKTLQWRHNGRDGVSNHQPHDCLLNRYPSVGPRKHQSSEPLAFVRGIYRWPVNFPHKWPVTRKLFPFENHLYFAAEFN